jgi:hypothetical protein
VLREHHEVGLVDDVVEGDRETDLVAFARRRRLPIPTESSHSSPLAADTAVSTVTTEAWSTVEALIEPPSSMLVREVYRLVAEITQALALVGPPEISADGSVRLSHWSDRHSANVTMWSERFGVPMVQ